MIAWQALIWGPMAAHSFVWVRIHCVWTTYRRQSLLDPDWRERLYRYLAGVASRKGALLLFVRVACETISTCTSRYLPIGP